MKPWNNEGKGTGNGMREVKVGGRKGRGGLRGSGRIEEEAGQFKPPLPPPAAATRYLEMVQFLHAHYHY